MRPRSAAVNLAAAAVVLVGCAQPERVLRAKAPGWAADGVDLVWRQHDVQVTAAGAYEAGEFPFGGCVANLGAAPLRVVLRPADGLGADEVVALRMTSGQWAPVRAGDLLDLPGRGVGSEPAPLCFRLPRTQGGTTVGRSYRHVPDGTDYVVEVAGPEGELACPFRFVAARANEGPDTPWWAWLLLPLAPIYWLLAGSSG